MAESLLAPHVQSPNRAEWRTHWPYRQIERNSKSRWNFDWIQLWGTWTNMRHTPLSHPGTMVWNFQTASQVRVAVLWGWTMRQTRNHHWYTSISCRCEVCIGTLYNTKIFSTLAQPFQALRCSCGPSLPSRCDREAIINSMMTITRRVDPAKEIWRRIGVIIICILSQVFTEESKISYWDIVVGGAKKTFHIIPSLPLHKLISNGWLGIVSARSITDSFRCIRSSVL